MVKRGAYCELSFSPNLSLIATVRRFVAEFYDRILGDPIITSRLVVATHELLENAVRYSSDGQSGIRIAVDVVDDKNGEVIVETKNRTSPEALASLTALMDEMKATPERDTFYQALLYRSSTREDGSGLGLGRIHAEAEMDLTCEIQADLVRLRAVARFPFNKEAAR
jgi:anti-sigma regulatory factor (Ser/Thr protein kinase)